MKPNYLFILFIFLFSTLLGSCDYIGKRMILHNFRDIDPAQFEADVKEYTSVEHDPIKIEITDWKNDQELQISTVFDPFEYVKLSNDPDTILGDINKIVFKDSCIYILDRWKTKSLKKFSRKGDYIATIGTRGEGPTDYFEPTDFMVSDDEIIVSDQFKSDLKYYDLSGNFKYARRAPFIFTKFFSFSPGQYVFHAVNADNYHLESILDWSVYETDSLFHIDHRGFFHPKDKYISFFYEKSFYPFAHKVFYNPPFNDTIYSISPEHRIQAEYILEFPKGKLPERYILQKNTKEFDKKGGDYALFMGDYVPTEDFLYFQYSVNNRFHQVIYSKKSKKYVKGNLIFNDINPPFSFGHILTSVENNILVGYVHAYEIKEHFDSVHRSEWVKHMGEEYTQIVESIKSEDNPILLFFKIKEF